MKILTVVGARPQFIKVAAVSRVLRREHEEILVHTGQHYDYNMSDIFFEELDIPKPDYNLGISGGTHGYMTGMMIIELEKVMIKEKPDAILVYGDTNSTMASAIAACKLHIPLIHVEAGNRLGSRKNPEELNRIITDHIATLDLYCTKSALPHIEKEGLKERAYIVGDPMYDAFKFYSAKIGGTQPEQLKSLDGYEVSLPKSFNYMTCHREENTADVYVLKNILDAMESLQEHTIYPVHPRNRSMVEKLAKENNYSKVIFVKPVGYLMSLYLLNHCNKVVTDSGGLQREAFFAGKQCVTIFEHVCWPETMVDNRNQLSRPVKEEILEKLSREQVLSEDMPFGDGHSADKIVHYIGKLNDIL